MATNTEILNLKKPSQEDFYNIKDFNENFEAIDKFAGRKDNPHKVTAEQTGALPVTGGEMSGYPTVNTPNDFQAISKKRVIGGNEYSASFGLGLSDVAGGTASLEIGDYSSGKYQQTGRLNVGRHGATFFGTDVSGGKTVHLFGEHNKPRGTYTGNGSSSVRYIETSGIGSLLLIYSDDGSAIVSPVGALILTADGKVESLAHRPDLTIPNDTAVFIDGVFVMYTNNISLNKSGQTYYYQVL